MSEISKELASRLVTGRKRDGRCTYDPEAKAEIVRACMQPGASVARIALQFSINANLVRTWIGKERGAGGMQVVDSVKRSDAGGAFMPIRLEAAKAEPIGEAASMLRLQVRLPNGVELDFAQAKLDELSSVMRILGEMSCSGSTSR